MNYIETVKKRQALPVFELGPCVSRIASGCTGYERPSTPGLCKLCDHAHQEWGFSPYEEEER